MEEERICMPPICHTLYRYIASIHGIRTDCDRFYWKCLHCTRRIYVSSRKIHGISHSESKRCIGK
ncbi:hypothetical protein DXA38_08465 [[Clostridium] innocuum]|uniref:SKI/SNO/DAC domain-containing protein n=1 Tax=Clostridium innocuum TaxID=1522 RepID=A0A3E2VY92_CLOIN|nr:hypothetical protein DXA38_08465 [[Clostridium] innocuum]RHV67689.1 hypothetical protein DXB22_04495 [Clostridiaceae bacterium OM02-2AC]